MPTVNKKYCCIRMYNCLTLNVISGSVFSGFGINKISQISRTFPRILAEFQDDTFLRLSVDVVKNSFFYCVIPKWNSLPEHIINQTNSDTFFDLCKTHFSEN